VSLKDLAINNKDLIELGYKEGKGIGEALKKLLDIVIDKPELNKKKDTARIFYKERKKCLIIRRTPFIL